MQNLSALNFRPVRHMCKIIGHKKKMYFPFYFTCLCKECSCKFANYHFKIEFKNVLLVRTQFIRKIRWYFISTVYIILFVCLGYREYSLIWRRQHYRWSATNFGLYSAFMTIEKWGFFNVPHLLWHEPTLYNGHLLGTHDIQACCRAFSDVVVTT